MKRVLLDQGIGRSAGHRLKEDGWEAVHVAELGLQQADDTDILSWAREHNQVCVTLDADFHMYLALQAATAPSVIRIRIEGLKAEAVADLLIREWPRLESSLLQGAAITITEANTRIRGLPIS